MQESPQSREQPNSGAEPPRAFHPVEHADQNVHATVGPTLGAEGRARGKRHRRTKRLGFGAFGQFVGMLVSAAIFLAIGYYLLNWFGGPKFNLLNLSLPGIADHAEP